MARRVGTGLMETGDNLLGLGLGKAVVQALSRAGIVDEQQLRAADRTSLSRIPGIGRKGLTLIYDVLDNKNGTAIHQIDLRIALLNNIRLRHQRRLDIVDEDIKLLEAQRAALAVS